MGKILDFFTHKHSKKLPGRSLDSILRDIRPHSISSLMLKKSSCPSKSYLGGDPYLPTNFEWPSKSGQPLTFLASLDLEEIGSAGAVSWLPKIGRLLFFYDAENQPWGFDPADRGGWSVVLVNDMGDEQSAGSTTLPRIFVEFEPADSFPGWERLDDLGVELNDTEVDTYIDGHYEWLDDEPEHQIGGYPRPVQGDRMELECQFASNGIYCGDGSAYESDEGKKLASGANDWRLLLQFSTDDDLGVMWGDVGDLYFWIREQDARKADFSNVWLVLQCC